MKALGFDGPYSGGSHPFMKKGTLKVTIPGSHGSNDIGSGLLKRILRQAEIDWEQWEKTQ